MSLKSTVNMNYHLYAFGSLEPSASIKHNVQLHFADQFYKNYTAYINTSPQDSRFPAYR